MQIGYVPSYHGNLEKLSKKERVGTKHTLSHPRERVPVSFAGFRDAPVRWAHDESARVNHGPGYRRVRVTTDVWQRADTTSLQIQGTPKGVEKKCARR
jgi:hypothetical protein